MSLKSLTLSQAIDGMLFYKRASGKSPNTIENYRIQLEKLKTYFSTDPLFSSITRSQLVEFFAWLQEGYVSKSHSPIPRQPHPLSATSISNIHASLSVLWKWAVEEGVVEHNIVRAIHAPSPNEPVVETFTKEQVEAILQACDHSQAWKNRTRTTNARPTADRDRLIVLLLLDTGMRASELCNLEMGDVNLDLNNIKIVEGKGSKDRVVFFGKRAAKSLWRYLTPRLAVTKPTHPLIYVGRPDDLQPMARQALRTLLRRIGERAGVPNVYPHRFRHTFAINYLRNGGDLFTLQELLGHTELEMVRRYARIAQIDCANAHQQASPVDNWKL